MLRLSLTCWPQVWTETCNDEIAHWARGIREMPPDRTFRVDDPIKSESIAMAEPVPAPRLPPQYSTWAAVAANCVEGKPAFARRAVDVQKDKARRRVQSTSGGAGEVEMTGVSSRTKCCSPTVSWLTNRHTPAVQELSAFMDSLRDTSRTPLEKLEADRYNVHWRGPSRGPEGERATLHAGTASEGGNMRCRTPIASSHEIGWNTQPLVRHLRFLSGVSHCGFCRPLWSLLHA